MDIVGILLVILLIVAIVFVARRAKGDIFVKRNQRRRASSDFVSTHRSTIHHYRCT